MTARKIKKLRSKIRTWKVWYSDHRFHHYRDMRLFDLATPRELKQDGTTPPVIIYGLDVEDALRRYARKRPWHPIARMFFHRSTSRFADAAVLPNHGLHRKPCAWNLNLPKDVEYWH